MSIDPTKTLVTLLLLALSSNSFAQTDAERAGARAAATKGVDAFAHGKWTEAADLMSRAEKLVHSPTHLLYLGQAQEHLGQLVAAQETYYKIVREKLKPEAPEVFRSAQQDAQKRLDALTSRVPQLTVMVQGAADDQVTSVTMDGKPVPEALVGVPHPVDPGAHEFVASTPTSRSTVAKIDLREGETETVTLTLSPTNAATTSTTPPPTDSKVTQSSVALNSSPVTQEASGTSSLRIASYATLGVGVAGLGLGTVFAIIASGKSADADKACNPGSDGKCRGTAAEVSALDSDAKSARTISAVGFVTGGVGVAAGLTMFLLSSPSNEAQPKSAWVSPYFGPASLGVIGGF